MRISKVLGLAAVAAIAAMAFIGAGSASAADEVVLCEVLPTGTLCPNANVLPAGTKILSLAVNPKLEGTITIQCADSTATTEITESMNEKLAFKITALEFGVLPTPSLGSGCTGCTGGVHTKAPYLGTVFMEGTVFKAKTSGGALIKGCPLVGECEFGSTNLEATIDPDATQHPAAGAQVKGDLLLINATLTRTGGSVFCGSTSTWNASYTTINCDKVGGGTTGCWISLREHL